VRLYHINLTYTEYVLKFFTKIKYNNNINTNEYVKVKQSHYRPGQTLRVSGG
jgi:hypothetical protein